VRSRLSHPIVEADGHFVETQPIVFDYYRQIAGQNVLDKFVTDWVSRRDQWYGLEPSERLRRRQPRPGYWTRPSSAGERATSMMPDLLYQHRKIERSDVWAP
jgi:hypothetical protein